MNKKLFILILCMLMFFCVCSVSVFAEEYIPSHSMEDLTQLFSHVKDYLEKEETRIGETLGETENMIVTQALVRSWAVVEMEDPAPEQIDDAYEALFNAFLFLGLNMETSDRLYTDPEIAETLFQSACQLLDQDYYDLMKQEGEPQENIEYAEYLRDIAEALVEDPSAFSEEETIAWITDIYAELYMASGLKAIAHTEKLPLPEELYGENDTEEEHAVYPITYYETNDELTDFLGISMPDLSKDFECEADYYAVIGGTVAEASYQCGDASVLLRLCDVPGMDIAGVFGADYYDTWEIYSTETEIYTFEDLTVAVGDVKTHDEKAYSFAVDAENADAASFEDVVAFFIESCRNQTSKQ